MKILGLGTSLGALFAAPLGAISITGEFRTGTMRPTFLVTPRRTRVVAAKAVASMLAGLGVGLVAAALTAGAEVVGLAARGIESSSAAATTPTGSRCCSATSHRPPSMRPRRAPARSPARSRARSPTT
jgi:hypothetical protein